MTIDVTTPTASYIIAGTGPYAMAWPYLADGFAAMVILAGVRTTLSPADISAVPASSVTTGNLYLTAGAAAIYAGGTLVITRATPPQQGWQGLLGEREAGLEAQLDQLAMTQQEQMTASASALRLDVPVPPLAGVPGAFVSFDANGLPIVAQALTGVAVPAGQVPAVQAIGGAAVAITDWDQARLYPNTPLSGSAAASLLASGYEFGVAGSTGAAGVGWYTPIDMANGSLIVAVPANGQLYQRSLVAGVWQTLDAPDDVGTWRRYVDTKQGVRSLGATAGTDLNTLFARHPTSHRHIIMYRLSTGHTNAPTGYVAGDMLLHWNSSDNNGFQMMISAQDARIWTRACVAGVIGAWVGLGARKTVLAEIQANAASHTVTGIPAWATEIEILLHDVLTSVEGEALSIALGSPNGFGGTTIAGYSYRRKSFVNGGATTVTTQPLTGPELVPLGSVVSNVVQGLNGRIVLTRSGPSQLPSPFKWKAFAEFSYGLSIGGGEGSASCDMGCMEGGNYVQIDRIRIKTTGGSNFFNGRMSVSYR